MAKTIVIPSAPIQAGTLGFGPLPVPPGALTIRVAIDRSNLSGITRSIAWTFELSTDGEKTWNLLGGTTLIPGPALDEAHQPLPESYLEARFTQPIGANTSMRGFLVTKETVTLAVAVTIT